MSRRTYSPTSRPYLRHRYEPSPHPETTSFPSPPLKRAFEDKNHFVRPSSAKGNVFDVLGEVKALRTAKSLPETSIKWFNTSPQYLESPPDREVTLGDFNPFRCRPFMACFCAAYSCCAVPNVCHDHFGSSRRRDPTRPNNEYFISQTLDNILLPPNLARMAYERDRCNLGAPAENYEDDDDDNSTTTKRAGMLAGICNQGERNAREVKDSNVQINVDGVYVEGRSRSARPTEFNKTEKETSFQRAEESSKKTRHLGAFCESKMSDEERKGKRFRSDPDSVLSFKMTVHNGERSWQNFKPVVDNCKRTHPYSKMDLRPRKENGFFSVDSQDKIGAFGIRRKERVSSTTGHFHQVESCGSTSGTPDELKISNYGAFAGAAGMQGRLEVTSARFPSFEMGCASEEPRARRSETTSTNNSSEFISLDSTKSAFMTFMKKMKAQPDAMLCPYCSQAFAQYPDFRRHVQTHQDLTRASADKGAPEMGGEKDKLHPRRRKTSRQTPPGPPLEPADDEGSKRATSVIMFAGQKK